MPAPAQSQQPRLLDEVRQVLRLHQYSIHTERSYADWIVRFVQHRVRLTATGAERRATLEPLGSNRQSQEQA